MPRRNLMSRQELEKAIAMTQLKYKDIIFQNDSRVREGRLKSFENR